MNCKQFCTYVPLHGCNIVRLYSRKISIEKLNVALSSASPVKPNVQRVLNYFQQNDHLNDVSSRIPSKYLLPNMKRTLHYLYLIDKNIAKDSVSRILPLLHKDPGVICETSAGLGLITSELLSKGVKSIRLYESCCEFGELLKEIDQVYPQRTELYTKDLFTFGSLAYADKMDRGNRVDTLLKGIPVRKWNDNPAFTIIGPMGNCRFINYLVNMLAYQSGLITFGRIELFAFIKPKDLLLVQMLVSKLTKLQVFCLIYFLSASF